MNFEGAPTDWFSQIYVGEIEIRLENIYAIQIYHKHEYEDLVSDKQELILSSPSPLQLQEVDQIKKKEEEEVQSHEPYLIEWYLNMMEMNIHEALSILHDTKSLVSNSCWKVSSLEEPSFLEDMEKIQRVMCNAKGNLMSFLFYRNNLADLNEWLHGAYLNNNEDIHKLKIQNEKLLERLQDTFSFSYVLDCHMADCLEDSHDMRDDEKHGKL